MFRSVHELYQANDRVFAKARVFVSRWRWICRSPHLCRKAKVFEVADDVRTVGAYATVRYGRSSSSASEDFETRDYNYQVS